METWKYIIGISNNYMVSDKGRIKRTSDNKIIKPRKNSQGFLRVTLVVKEVKKDFLIHRVEYESFIAGHKCSSITKIFHKNGNKKDNNLKNLSSIPNNLAIPKNEHFRYIDGFNKKYMIGDLGDVLENAWIGYNNHTSIKRLLPQRTDKDGYCLVNLQYNHMRKTYRVHRLVAKAFIPNPSNKPTVNHKDEIKSNNTVNNLEWMTSKEQNNYGKFKGTINKLKLASTKKRVIGMANGETIYTFPSIREASRQLSINRSGISQCCNHKVKHAGKYHGIPISWKFLNY